MSIFKNKIIRDFYSDSDKDDTAVSWIKEYINNELVIYQLLFLHFIRSVLLLLVSNLSLSLLKIFLSLSTCQNHLFQKLLTVSKSQPLSPLTRSKKFSSLL